MNRTEIINSEKNKLKQKKLSAEIKAQNVVQVLRQNKEYASTETLMRKKMLEIVALPENKTKDLRKEYNALQQKLESIAKKLGYSPTDLVPNYTCKKCNDTGFYNHRICECLSNAIKLRLQQESGLADFKGHKFTDSKQNILAENQTLNKAYNYALNYVKNFPNNKLKNIVFSGNVGTGKTFLSECIANALIKRDYYVVYITSFELNNIVKKITEEESIPVNIEFKYTNKSMDIFADNRQEILSPLLDCDLLIIDDLGSEPIFKNASVNNLYTIINQRQLNNLSTIISTNLTPQMIRDQYGDRLFSRIFNKQNTMTIHFDGKDLRINKN